MHFNLHRPAPFCEDGFLTGSNDRTEITLHFAPLRSTQIQKYASVYELYTSTLQTYKSCVPGRHTIDGSALSPYRVNYNRV